MRRRVILGAMAALVTVGAAPAPTVIYVTRHYDTPAGERDPDLTATGAARAKALAAWFRGRTLGAIYVTGFKRTQQTIAPLASARRLTPIVYGPAPTPEFLARLKGAKAPVLVVGHSNTVPHIIAGLGGERPGEIAHDDFGTLWAVGAGRAVAVRILP